jgi:PadR family transcriptional regulator PadR
LLERREMYGWEIIDMLAKKSFDTFCFKTGVLYPVLHTMENDGYVVSESRRIENGRVRKYYYITDRGREYLVRKQAEWNIYTKAVNAVMNGDVDFATV